MTRLVEPYDRVADRLETVGWDGLTAEEQNYHALWLLEAYLNNAGLEQLFAQCTPSDCSTMVRALAAVGAGQMHDLFAEAMAISASRASRPRSSARTTDDDLRDLDDPDLRRLSDRMGDYPDDLGVLIDRYVQNNAAFFLGPQTAVELWESRRARGKEKPRFITDAMAHSTRDTDERMSSRSCPNCGYPSPDFRISCRECGYPHGRVPNGDPS